MAKGSSPVRVGTLRVTYSNKPTRPVTYEGIARQDEVQAAQQELRKHQFPNQRGGAAQNVKKNEIDVPLYRTRGGNRPGLTPMGKITLKLAQITTIEFIGTATVEIPDMS